MSADKYVHVPYPKATPAFMCAGCGAVALFSDGV
jgi:hypothetical protein